MAQLTVTIDDDLLRRARNRAIGNDTSVNALIRDFLETYAASELDDIRAGFLDHVAEHAGASGAGGRPWIRDELHDR